MNLLLCLQFLLLAGLSTSQSPPVYTPVPYQQAPAYYPGAPWTFLPASTRSQNVCYVTAPSDGSDAAPYIRDAFRKCQVNATVVFNSTTYHINTTMQTENLSNVDVDIRGTLLWSNDTLYWTHNSLPEGYQNQSTAWIFGGDHVHIYGNGTGTLNGNGDVWYGDQNNAPGRPHQITFRNLTNSVVEGVRFLKSQMWTMTLTHCQNVLLQDIYINSTGPGGGRPQNTDGANTLYSDNITFVRWVVANGDDSISTKANSTNILIEDSTFYLGFGLALGSIGQYLKQYETIINVTARRIYAIETRYAMYAKVWTGTPTDTLSNNTGGGTGLIKNITMENVTVTDVGVNSGHLFNTVTGIGGPSNTSLLQMEDIRVRNATGTSNTTRVASIQCSAAAPCPGFELSNISITTNGKLDIIYDCNKAVVNTMGFTCNESIS